MNIKTFLCSLGIMFLFPYGIIKLIPANIREARLIEQAPRHTVTVVQKWTRWINPKTYGYWIKFQETVANPREVQITSEEWDSLAPGSHITIAVLPDGRPHTLASGASVRFEQFMFVAAIALWVVATAYVVIVVRGWIKRIKPADPKLHI